MTAKNKINHVLPLHGSDFPSKFVVCAYGVPTSRTASCEELAAALAAGLARRGGPTLIEALLP